MLILNHFLVLLNLSSQIWRWFMTFEINQWYQSQPKKLKHERGHLPPFPRLRYWSLMKFGPLVPMHIFRHFQLFLEKICLTLSKCFHVCAHKSFAYYQLQQNKSKFLDYISESFLRKGISWIVGDLTFPVYMILGYNLISLFGYSICVWRLKLCISFVWKC